MPVDARRLIRKMRGGSQAHLIEASDANFYVVKFLNNPQHRRILVNEWIGSAFLSYLGISAPEASIIRVSEDFLRANPDVHFQLGSRRHPVEPGWHFGSRFPGDPARNVVYDFLPDSLLDKVENLGDFPATLAFDKWMGNADSRQAVFFRARLRTYLPDSGIHPLRVGFVAHMVDHGFIFEGPHWRFTDSPLQGLYFRPGCTGMFAGWTILSPGLAGSCIFRKKWSTRRSNRSRRRGWKAKKPHLRACWSVLLARRSRVPALIEASRQRPVQSFPELALT